MRLQGLLSIVGALLIALLLPLALPNGKAPRSGLAFAQEMNFTVAGRITRHEGNKLTLNSEGNMIFRVTYNEKTEITRADGSPGSSQDLQVGKTVQVAGDLQESGEIIAQKIEFVKEPEKH
jgi:hypothetical protein